MIKGKLVYSGTGGPVRIYKSQSIEQSYDDIQFKSMTLKKVNAGRCARIEGIDKYGYKFFAEYPSWSFVFENDEQDLNECTGAPEADAKRGGFIANTKPFTDDFLPEGYPIFGHPNCRCKAVWVGGLHTDGKWHEAQLGNKYLHEIKPGIFVDVYDVLMAWNVTNPALQHLIKKALQAGDRGHKSRKQDLQDIIDSAIRAKELESK